MTSIDPDDASGADELIRRLRARAADPKRRSDERAGGLLGGLRDLFSTGAPRPADPRRLREAESALGLSLPPLLARAYTEVADGGFGPHEGLLSLDALVRRTLQLRTGEELPRNRTWPGTLVPLVALNQGWLCVDCATGAIVEWDYDDMSERMSEARFLETFSEASPSVEAWLGKWVVRKTAADRNKPSQAERWERMKARAQSPEGQERQRRKTMAALAEMSPEDRARFGFDDLVRDLGWDRPADDGGDGNADAGGRREA